MDKVFFSYPDFLIPHFICSSFDCTSGSFDAMFFFQGTRLFTKNSGKMFDHGGTTNFGVRGQILFHAR
jgi:hypothetical protein